MLVAAPRVASHFLDRVFSNANLAILDWPESFDPVVEQIIQPPAEAFGLLVSEIADVEGRILELFGTRDLAELTMQLRGEITRVAHRDHAPGRIPSQKPRNIGH